MSCLYILEINTLLVVSFAIIFSHSVVYLFTLFILSFDVQKLLSLIRSHLFYFCFYFHYSGRWVIEDPAVISVRECFAYVSRVLYIFLCYRFLANLKISQVVCNVVLVHMASVQLVTCNSLLS